MDEYGFLESFCDECDCRRVFFTVLSRARKEPVATITWGWESKAFYIKWFGRKDEDILREMMGTSLSISGKQSAISEKLLVMFNEVLFKDDDYTSRIKNHYDLFRSELKRVRK